MFIEATEVTVYNLHSN